MAVTSSEVRRLVQNLTAQSFISNISKELSVLKRVSLQSVQIGFLLVLHCWGTRWRSWLRHCATSRKVAGSIPDGVTGIFH